MIITSIMVLVDIAAGVLYGSMALLADGLHIGSHAAALGIAVFACAISRRLATGQRFAFRVGKLNSLGGFGGSVMLMGFALIMVVGRIERLVNPLAIAFPVTRSWFGQQELAL